MGAVQILGHTSGEVARVDANNRLHVQATTDSSQHSAVAAKRGYNINTGWVTMTDAADTGLLYFKNNEANDFHVEQFVFGFDTHANGTATDLVRVRIIKSITSGDIIDDAVVCPVISNSYVGSGTTLDADVFIGDTADGAHTGGTVHAHIGSSDFAHASIPLIMSIPKGENILITVDAPASTDSFPMYAAMIGHITDPESD